MSKSLNKISLNVFVISLVILTLGIVARSMSVRQLITVFPRTGGDEKRPDSREKNGLPLRGDFKGRSTIRIKQRFKGVVSTQDVTLSQQKSFAQRDLRWVQEGSKIYWRPRPSLLLSDPSPKLKIPLALSKENKIFFDREATEIWVDYRDFYSPNVARVGVELFAKAKMKYSAASRKIFLYGATNVGEKKSETISGSNQWKEKGIAYRLGKYLRLKPNDSWHYSRDGKYFVLQKRMHLPVSEGESLDLPIEPNTPVFGIGVRITDKDNFGIGKYIDVSQPTRAMLQNGLVSIDLQKMVRQSWQERLSPSKGKAFIQELIVFVEEGEDEWVLKQKPIRNLVLTYKTTISGNFPGIRNEPLPTRIEYLPAGRKRLIVNLLPLQRRFFDLEVGLTNVVISPTDVDEISFFQIEKVLLVGEKQGSSPLYLEAGPSLSARWGGPFLGLGNLSEKVEWPIVEAYFPFNALSSAKRPATIRNLMSESIDHRKWIVTSQLDLSPLTLSPLEKPISIIEKMTGAGFLSKWKDPIGLSSSPLTVQSIVSVSSEPGTSSSFEDSMNPLENVVMLSQEEIPSQILKPSGNDRYFFSQIGTTFISESTLLSTESQYDGIILEGYGQWLEVDVPVSGQIGISSFLYFGVGEGAETVRKIQVILTFSDGRKEKFWSRPNEALSLNETHGHLKKVKIRLDLKVNHFRIKMTELALFSLQALSPVEAFKGNLLADVSDILHPQRVTGLPKDTYQVGPVDFSGTISANSSKVRNLQWSTDISKPVRWLRGLKLAYRVPGQIVNRNHLWLQLVFHFNQQSFSRDLCLEQSEGDVFIPWAQIVNSIGDISSWGDLKSIDWNVRLDDLDFEPENPWFRFSARIDGRCLRTTQDELENWNVATIGESEYGMNPFGGTPVQEISQILKGGGRISWDLDSDAVNRIVLANGKIKPNDHRYFELESVVLEPIDQMAFGSQVSPSEPPIERRGDERTLILLAVLICIILILIRKPPLQNLFDKTRAFLTAMELGARAFFGKTYALVNGFQHTRGMIITVFWLFVGFPIIGIGLKDFFLNGDNASFSVGSVFVVILLFQGVKLMKTPLMKLNFPFTRIVYSSTDGVFCFLSLLALFVTGVFVMFDQLLLTEHSARIFFISIVFAIFLIFFGLIRESKNEKDRGSVEHHFKC